ETLEQAEYAATLVRATYEAQPPVTGVEAQLERTFPPQEGLGPNPPMGRPADVVRGDPEALGKAEVRVGETYTIPIEHHNPMEPHATIAEWDASGRLTLHDKTQWVSNVHEQIASVFGIPQEDVRVVCPFVGGAFGSALRTWSHPIVAALAARVVGRPVKLVLSRRQ